MEETCKFPGGKDVVVVRKQDIIDCIYDNITDREVALAIVQQCEVDAISFLRQGRWAGIPFLGNIRANPIKKLEKSKERQELINTAFNTLTKEEYCLFRKELAHDERKRLKANSFYKWRLASAVRNNNELYKKIVKEKGEAYANIRFSFRPSVVQTRNYGQDSDN